MRDLIAAMNMTLDGFCDHTSMSADDEIHQHYNDLLAGADTLIYGRTTYQLMESHWPNLVKQPSGNKPMDDFAVLIDDIRKIVYSRTLAGVEWKNAELKHEIDAEEINELKRTPGKPIVVGSPSMIVSFARLGLVDEFQIGLHPTVAGGGLPLFKEIGGRIDLELTGSKTFSGGSMMLYYRPAGGKNGFFA